MRRGSLWISNPCASASIGIESISTPARKLGISLKSLRLGHMCVPSCLVLVRTLRSLYGKAKLGMTRSRDNLTRFLVYLIDDASFIRAAPGIADH